MKEFKVNEHTYSCSKLSTFDQLHASRKGAPLFIGVANSFWFQILHDMSEEDLNYLIHLIMPYVSRQDSVGWQRIYSKEAKSFQYEDIAGGDVLEIIFQVLLEYLPAFIDAAGRMVSGMSPEQVIPAS